jgi:hypothetical protein
VLIIKFLDGLKCTADNPLSYIIILKVTVLLERTKGDRPFDKLRIIGLGFEEPREKIKDLSCKSC